MKNPNLTDTFATIRRLNDQASFYASFYFQDELRQAATRCADLFPSAELDLLPRPGLPKLWGGYISVDYDTFFRLANPSTINVDDTSYTAMYRYRYPRLLLEVDLHTPALPGDWETLQALGHIHTTTSTTTTVFCKL